ncbi:hypothetical protein [Georgenia yuyongxinii]|uniref:Uncharacterized protein n=1 Tax=Georgenia yuyongxinii TaxID=2589797 RepID=A0A552WU64_9MICO|nr:hypothetical protein [Georgenia yuyongxinii]TRW46388.1 hypothetical protein FJ693_05530 [Georgenia yuyongxinii]
MCPQGQTPPPAWVDALVSGDRDAIPAGTEVLIIDPDGQGAAWWHLLTHPDVEVAPTYRDAAELLEVLVELAPGGPLVVIVDNRATVLYDDEDLAADRETIRGKLAHLESDEGNKLGVTVSMSRAPWRMQRRDDMAGPDRHEGGRLPEQIIRSLGRIWVGG